MVPVKQASGVAGMAGSKAEDGSQRRDGSARGDPVRPDRKARLAEALRENLRRRKAQARDRARRQESDEDRGD